MSETELLKAFIKACNKPTDKSRKWVEEEAAKRDISIFEFAELMVRKLCSYRWELKIDNRTRYLARLKHPKGGWIEIHYFVYGTYLLGGVNVVTFRNPCYADSFYVGADVDTAEGLFDHYVWVATNLKSGH